MKRFLTLALVTALCGGAAAAQTRQAASLGESGDSLYPLRVQATNGAIYHCKEEIVVLNNTRARECIRAGEAAGIFAQGDGLSAGLAAGGVALVVLGIAAASDDDGDGAVTTTE